MNTDYTQQLSKLGRTLKQWEAQVLAAWGLAAVLSWLAVLSLVDVLVQVNRAGRAFSAIGVFALLGYTAWRVIKTLKRSYSPEAVAARVERTFPELDNHLINHLQFAQTHDDNPFKLAYIRQEEPKWQGLDFRQLRNRQAYLRSAVTLAGMVCVMGILWLSLGSAFGIAVWRMINPFSAVVPVTLTTLIEVTPGNTTVLQGSPVVIDANVKGFAGHSVKIDVRPEDGDNKTVILGTISDSKEQTFSHRLSQVNARVRYRLRAGDAPASEWFTVDTRPPPAFIGVALTMKPPSYTGKSDVQYDALAEQGLVYQGATIDLDVQCNTPLDSLQIVPAMGNTGEMIAGESNRVWKGSITATGGQAFTLRAVDIYGMAFEEQISYQLISDRPPELHVASPSGRVQLPPGQSPRIEFSVIDDYGLISAEIQEVTGADDGAEDGTIIQSWPLDNKSSHAAVWTRETALRSGGDVTYRVVVKDNCPFGEQKVFSLPLTFGTAGYADAAKERNELEEKAFAGLQQIIELQRTNLDQTKTGLSGKERTTPNNWTEMSERQKTIRTLTREMLGNSVEPFGGLTPTVKKLYLEEMAMAVQLLDDLQNPPDETKTERGNEALRVQEHILKQLGYAQAEASSSAAERRVSALTTMLDAMIREQGTILKKTQGFQQSGVKIGTALVDAQDILPEDLTAFQNACAEEAEALRGNDVAFATTLDGISALCVSLKIRDNMVLSAERLDQNLLADALTFQDKSLTALLSLQKAMGDVALKQEEEKRTVLAGALGNAKEKLERIRDLRHKMLENMDAIRGQKDQSEGVEEDLEEAYAELVRNTRESVLDIPTDLHTFADMLAANDLVEDVFEVFQEIEQSDVAPKSDQEIMKLDFAKEDANLEQMDEAIKRIDELETWLQEKSDDKRVTAEAFDREEMPDEGTAKGELADAVEDLISDLLEEDEKQEDEAQDSATTHGVTDMETGWGVEEGETVTFSAKGKSGNRTPDHKEQDGRSNVGRQGMAVGETAAASGTINKGDENIEERRTEDPTQAGKIDLAGEADTRATGGGKKGSGKADAYGMSGGVKRIDSSEEGSWEGMAALMAKQIDAIYAKASLKNIRVDALKEAAHHLRQAEDAIASGNIEQMKEFRRLAAFQLQQAQALLDAGPGGSVTTESASGILDDVVEGGSDMAPAEFRDKVAEYYRALNDIL